MSNRGIRCSQCDSKLSVQQFMAFGYFCAPACRSSHLVDLLNGKKVVKKNEGSEKAKSIATTVNNVILFKRRKDD